jgi:spore coat polysaccharide biosynthesis protein SpsF (cytidylyltransferase family)
MELSEIISFSVGVIGTAIAIYQFAVIKESQKRKNEIQYILAGINHAALQKQISWQNQISTLPKLESPQDWEFGRVLLRARDDFQELASLTQALEGTIDTENSAISKLMQKSIDITKLNNELQAEGMKNPTIRNNISEPETNTNKQSQPTQ